MVTVAHGPAIEVVQPMPVDATVAVRSQWARCCEASDAWLAEVLKLGGMLVALKKQVGHGKFGKLFEGKEALPFGQLLANRLMATIDNDAISSHGKNLPHDVQTLHALAQLPAQKLTKMLESGEVNSNTTRAQAADFVRKVKTKSAPAAAPPSDKNGSAVAKPSGKRASILRKAALRRNDRIWAHLASIPDMCERVRADLLLETAAETARWKEACIDAVRAIRKVYRSIKVTIAEAAHP
jgi:hypothetical protein